MAPPNGFEHHTLGQLGRIRFNHHHSGFGRSDDEIHFRGLALGHRWVQDVLTVGVTDAGSANRRSEWDASEVERSGCADDRWNVRIDLRIERHYGRDDLNFVVETFGKQRANRAINQARRERLFLAWAAFALEETAGDFACSVGLFLIVDGQREEVLAFFNGCLRDGRNEHDGVAVANEHGGIGLTANFAGLKGEGMCAILNGLSGCGQHRLLPFFCMRLINVWGAIHGSSGKRGVYADRRRLSKLHCTRLCIAANERFDRLRMNG